jgi:hypothetical protein
LLDNVGSELTQFKSGDQWTGNAAGRPRKLTAEDVRERIQLVLAKVTCLEKPNPYGYDNFDCILESAVYHVCKGNSALLRILLEYGFGLPIEGAPDVSMEEAAKRLAEKRAKKKKDDRSKQD